MKIDRTLKIKEKYFNAILKLEKPFELRHQAIPENSIVKLECIENGRYLIFKSGNCKLLTSYWPSGFKQTAELTRKWEEWDIDKKETLVEYVALYKKCGCLQIKIKDIIINNYLKWFDNFCWEYITKAPTYLIEIAEILEVK